ncbi:hypothetical protein CpecG_0963 [Chlamydia pecorum MC/MarsBar]|nr:hypothetical protein CpecG_0963 [Chlamydia pecorum MC/MarsBar]ETF39574.1 hypothetical protein CpecA_0963 [Chlamydia pecorum IPTaLE]
MGIIFSYKEKQVRDKDLLLVLFRGGFFLWRRRK